MENKRCANCEAARWAGSPTCSDCRTCKGSTVPIILCADAQIHSGDVLQLALHSSRHQTEYSFGGGLLEV